MNFEWYLLFFGIGGVFASGDYIQMIIFSGSLVVFSHLIILLREKQGVGE